MKDADIRAIALILICTYDCWPRRIPSGEHTRFRSLNEAAAKYRLSMLKTRAKTVKHPNRFDWKIAYRVVFWITGITLSVAVAYGARYYTNSDAITYVEMGEAFARGDWWGMVNLTFSPVYAITLAAAQAFLVADPLQEIIRLKIVGFVWFLVTMIAADVMISSVRRGLGQASAGDAPPLSGQAFTALSYVMFLVTALVSIRVQLMNPDMGVFFVALVCGTALLKIRSDPQGWGPYLVLTVAASIGYLLKSFFFLYAALLFAVAFLASASLRGALPRLTVALLLYTLIISPWIIALSAKKGGFTYGEGGRHTYAIEVAGEGEPVYMPKALVERPATVVFDDTLPGTRPYSHDVAYWSVGVKPAYKISDHATMVLDNVGKVFSQNTWLIVVGAWAAVMAALGKPRIGGLRPLSLSLVILIPAVGGIGLFSLIRMEPRYIAPFLFMGFVGILTTFRFPNDDSGPRAQGGPREKKSASSVRSSVHPIIGVQGFSREGIYKHRAIIGCLVLLVFLLGVVIQSAIAQVHRGLLPSGGKPSRLDAYFEQISVHEHLSREGLTRGDRVAVVGNPPLYWARMGGLKIVGEILDRSEFLAVDSEARARVMAVLASAGIKAVLSHGPMPPRLVDEGWQQVPGTGSYWTLHLHDFR